MSSLQACRVDVLEDIVALVEGSSRPLVEGSSRAIVEGSGRARVEGSSRGPGDSMAPDVRTWLASPEQGLSAAITSVCGADASAAALARLAPSRLTLLASVRSETARWAEITRHGDAGPETCLAGLTYEPGGTHQPGTRVSRIIWLRAPLVPPCRLSSSKRTPDARPVLESYFAALMTSRFREAAAHFTADTLYSHPPYGGGNQRVLFRGRDALVRGFETERGPSPARQIITDLWQQDSRVFVEGVIEGIPDGGTFFSTAELSPTGEIARYVAFYSAVRIPSTRSDPKDPE